MSFVLSLHQFFTSFIVCVLALSKTMGPEDLAEKHARDTLDESVAQNQN